MTEHIRDRINRKLDNLAEDRLYQILDYVEFLESRYAQRAATPPNTFQKLADTLEDRLRMGGIAASTVSEAMGFLNRAVGVLNGAVTAGRSVATDALTAAQKAGSAVVDAVNSAATAPAGSPGATPAAPQADGASGTAPAQDGGRDGAAPPPAAAS